MTLLVGVTYDDEQSILAIFPPSPLLAFEPLHAHSGVKIDFQS